MHYYFYDWLNSFKVNGIQYILEIYLKCSLAGYFAWNSFVPEV